MERFYRGAKVAGVSSGGVDRDFYPRVKIWC